MNSDLFVDPAIVSLSQPPARPKLSQQKSILEPGSALSKLLDSAMANAAKEETPDSFGPTGNEAQLETPSSPTPTSSGPVQDWMLTLIPECKQNRDKVYSIQKLLQLHTDPNVALYDTTQLPQVTFWQLKHKSVPEINRNAPGNQKRNRRANGNNNNINSSNGGHDTGRSWEHGNSKLSWDRRPAGFLKQSELESMSRDKISQLLGENPNEDAPEWDTPIGNVSGKSIDMGSTVEDFERWKQQMRNEERRRNGEEVLDLPETNDTVKGNDVDNFFSFVNDSTQRNSTGSLPEVTRAPVKDSSKFSSFFGALPLSLRVATEVPPEQSSEERSEQKAPPSGRSLRFFKSDAPSPAQALPSKQTQPQQPQPKNLASKAPNSNDPPTSQYPRYPSGIPPGISHSGTKPPVPPPGYPAHGIIPPAGMVQPHAPGMGPPGLNGPPGGSNDNFFFSLLQKRGDEIPGQELKQNPVSSLQKGDSPQFSGANYPSIHGNVPPNHPFFGRPPPGMYPPGMPLPGASGHPQHMIQGQVHTNNHNMMGGIQPGSSNVYGQMQPGKPGNQPPQPQQQQPQNQQQPQAQQRMPSDLPPWMRLQPGPNGQMPQPQQFAYPPMGPGFPPGLASNQTHPQGK